MKKYYLNLVDGYTVAETREEALEMASSFDVNYIALCENDEKLFWGDTIKYYSPFKNLP